MLVSYKNHLPEIDKSAKILQNAVIAGNVVLKENVNVWFNVSIRGDMEPITIGANTNVQDNAVIHTSLDHPVVIGENVTIGHGAIIHAATIEDDCLIGMGSIVLDGAVIKKGALIGAGAVIPPNKVVPEYSLVVGNPMKIIRTLSEKEIEANKENMEHYLTLMNEYE